jgi:putative hydrolase of the HAD superfamily
MPTIKKYILFDLDETLYPRGAGLMQEIGRLISLYMEDKLGLPPALVTCLRREYFQHYGTTMRGLQINYGIDRDEYLEYVHDIRLEDYIGPNKALDKVLADIDLEKVVFTNASAEHARRVLKVLGIERHFKYIVDVRAMNFLSKPNPAAYQRILEILGATGPQCIFVEDRVRNLRQARELGMTTILVDGNPDADADVVDFAISDVVEVGEVVKQIQREERIIRLDTAAGPKK